MESAEIIRHDSLHSEPDEPQNIEPTPHTRVRSDSVVDAEKDQNFRAHLHYPLFAAVYFAQGVSFTFGAVFEAAYLRDRGVDDGTIGIVRGLAHLPFVVKVFFGLISDKYPIPGWGRRIPYIIIGQLIGTFTWFPLVWVSPRDSIVLYIALRLFQISGVASADVCVDALASETVSSMRMSLTQGVMESSRAVGAIGASLLFGMLESTGFTLQFQLIFIITSAFDIIPIFFAYFLKGRELGSPENEYLTTKTHLSQLQCSDFKSLYQFHMICFLLMYFISAFLMGSRGLITTLYLIDRFNVSKQELGFIGTLESTGTLLGAFIWGGILSSPYFQCFKNHQNQQKAILIFALIFSIGAVFVLLVTPMFTPLYGLFFLSSVVAACNFIINQGLVLSSAPVNVAGSFAAILNMAPSSGRMIGHFVAGFLSKSTGQRLSLFILTCVSCVKFFLIPFIFKDKSSSSKIPSTPTASSTSSEEDSTKRLIEDSPEQDKEFDQGLKYRNQSSRENRADDINEEELPLTGPSKV